MRRDGHIEGLGHGGDFSHFQNAAAVAHVRLQNVHAAPGEHALKAPAGEIALAGGDGDINRAGEFQKFVFIFREHGLFHEHQVVFFQLFHQKPGHGFMHPAMEIHGDAQLIPHGFPNGGHPVHGFVQLFVVVDPLQFVRAVHFHRVIALGKGLFRGGSGIPGMIAADPAIHLNAIPAFAPQHLIDAHAVGLALDIPHGLLDAGKGAGKHRAAPVKAGAIEHLEGIFDFLSGFADEGLGHFPDAGGHRVGAAFHHGFAPAHQAGFGGHFQKQPPGRDLKQFDGTDFHGNSSVFCACQRLPMDCRYCTQGMTQSVCKISKPRRASQPQPASGLPGAEISSLWPAESTAR